MNTIGNRESFDSKRTVIKALSVGAAMLPGWAVARSVPSPEPYFPDVSVETHDGRRLRFYTDLVMGKTVVFNAMYTACSRICPPNTASLRMVQEALGGRVGKDIHIYSLTLQPEIDSPQALQDYAKQYGIGKGWVLLRAAPKDLLIIRRKLGFFNTDPIADADISKHTGMIRAGNEPLDRWCMMPALSPTAQIVRAIVNL